MLEVSGQPSCRMQLDVAAVALAVSLVLVPSLARAVQRLDLGIRNTCHQFWSKWRTTTDEGQGRSADRFERRRSAARRRPSSSRHS
jgi:hypothetical protein